MRLLTLQFVSRMVCLTSLMIFIAALSTGMARAQAKIDIDATDVAAFQQKLQAADAVKKLPAEGVRKGPEDKICMSGKFGKGYVPRDTCADVWRNYPVDQQETILLKGCSYSNPNDGLADPCLILARLYTEQGRYFEALAVYQSPNISRYLNSQVSQNLREEANIYGLLGNTTQQSAMLSRVCPEGCEAEAAEDAEFMNQIHSEEQADEQVAEQDAANRRAALLNAITNAVSGIGSGQTGTVASSPSYESSQSNPATSSVQLDPITSSSCRDMSRCVQVVSSTYDDIHTLRVFVKNICSETIVAMVSITDLGVSCTRTATQNLAPGQTIDMGGQTNQNHYWILANDNIFLPNGMYKYPLGCSILPKTDCQ